MSTTPPSPTSTNTPRSAPVSATARSRITRSTAAGSAIWPSTPRRASSSSVVGSGPSSRRLQGGAQYAPPRAAGSGAGGGGGGAGLPVGRRAQVHDLLLQLDPEALLHPSLHEAGELEHLGGGG